MKEHDEPPRRGKDCITSRDPEPAHFQQGSGQARLAGSGPVRARAAGRPRGGQAAPGSRPTGARSSAFTPAPRGHRLSHHSARPRHSEPCRRAQVHGDLQRSAGRSSAGKVAARTSLLPAARGGAPTLTRADGRSRGPGDGGEGAQAARRRAQARPQSQRRGRHAGERRARGDTRRRKGAGPEARRPGTGSALGKGMAELWLRVGGCGVMGSLTLKSHRLRVLPWWLLFVCFKLWLLKGSFLLSSLVVYFLCVSVCLHAHSSQQRAWS